MFLAAAMLLGQPEPPADGVQGIVLRHDGRVADDARVELRCGDWRRTGRVGPDGTFAFHGVPDAPCTLVAQSPADTSAGVSLDVSRAASGRLSIILPAGIAATPPAAGPGLRIDLSSGDSANGPVPLIAPARVSGTASWSSGLDPHSPGARPDQWTVRATMRRPGPWGTLLTGTVSARRLSGASTLVSDVAGIAAPGPAMWSALFDPTRPTILWDARLGVEKEWSVGGLDVTLFGDAYRSFQGGSSNTLFMPLPESATKGLRTGTAGRVGVRLGF